MKTQRLIFNPFLIVAVLFILAVSVAPAMAAGADSRNMNSFTAGSAGPGSSSSNIGSKDPVSGNRLGISAGSSVPRPGAKSESAGSVKSPAEVPWYQKWWVWLIVAVVVVVAVVVTVATCGTAAPAIAEVVEQPLVFIGIFGGVPVYA
jgi:hypothetical protein